MFNFRVHIAVPLPGSYLHRGNSVSYTPNHRKPVRDERSSINLNNAYIHFNNCSKKVLRALTVKHQELHPGTDKCKSG